jgi:hypothetical protein
MPPVQTASTPASEPRIPYAAYPFGAFAAQSILGVRPIITPSRERSGTA